MDLKQDMQRNPTIFGKILRGEIQAQKVYEDEFILAFHDISPKAPVHILVIPKKHIVSVAEARPEDAKLLGHMMIKIPEIAALAGLKDGFRIISNSGLNSGQEVPHLHIHLLGGKRLGGLIGA